MLFKTKGRQLMDIINESEITENQSKLQDVNRLINQARSLITRAADELSELTGYSSNSLNVSQFANNEDIDKVTKLREISKELHKLILTMSHP